jgi:hypothetical protein
LDLIEDFLFVIGALRATVHGEDTVLFDQRRRLDFGVLRLGMLARWVEIFVPKDLNDGLADGDNWFEKGFSLKELLLVLESLT